MSEKANPDSVGQALLAAPAVFVCHFLEEAPGFVEWFNSHVARGISSGLFWRVNLTALVVTLILVALYWFTRSRIILVVSVAWLSFLMFANALFHLTGSVVDRGYVPGLMTAVLLYLPYCAILATYIVRNGLLGKVALTVVVLLGSTPMLIHGYLILFLGSRLF